MAKKRKAERNHGSENGREATPKPIFASPFKDLGKLVRQHQLQKPPPAPIPKPTVSKSAERADPAPIDDETLLRQALNGVRQLNDSRPLRMPVEPPVGRAIVSEDAEVLARLSDLVSGRAPFDITETEEYVEG